MPIRTTTSAFKPRGATSSAPKALASQIVRCFRCGGPHYLSQCLQTDVRVYFSCQQLRHLARDCPTPSGAVSSSASALHAVRPKATKAPTTTRSIAEGRVFTTFASEAAQATDLVQGTTVVTDTFLSVLFDSEATHFYCGHLCEKLRM
ncbi:uncharacterized protein LOC113867548 [Abrus precatorius]|uniref:Uncharacterized protein LOC113867548 n=1 Tax=Abrus precatorius TaxID=3816 RepID=A0A8B8LR25_ABRPR|nr:uncharacterized protein LOC113867548 [Abrus precatorius]